VILLTIFGLVDDIYLKLLQNRWNSRGSSVYHNHDHAIDFKIEAFHSLILPRLLIGSVMSANIRS